MHLGAILAAETGDAEVVGGQISDLGTILATKTGDLEILEYGEIMILTSNNVSWRYLGG